MVTQSLQGEPGGGDTSNRTSPVGEKILLECHRLYTDPDKGLIDMGKEFDLTLLAPRKKIFILLIGNHSAGKSSFINWYIGERLLRTGVAIETQGFTLVTSGKKRETLTGKSTLHLYPRFKPLENMKGVVDFLSTEISTSVQRCSNLVTFIDTPGLVDGDMYYPYDVEGTIKWLGEIADQIFVFFDPIGQALCRRTLNVVEQLNKVHAEKLRLFLSKADDAGDEADRQKVLMQIVQELCKRPSLNRNGFNMPSIFIPNNCKPNDCVNQIKALCSDIENIVSRNVQMALNTLEQDSKSLESAIENIIKEDDKNIEHNSNVDMKASVIAFSILGLFSTILFGLILSNHSESRTQGTPLILRYIESKEEENDQMKGKNAMFFGLLLLLGISYFFYRYLRVKIGLKPTLANKKKKHYLTMLQYIKETVKIKKQTLLRDYLLQSTEDMDFLPI